MPASNARVFPAEGRSQKHKTHKTSTCISSKVNLPAAEFFTYFLRPSINNNSKCKAWQFYLRETTFEYKKSFGR